MADYNPGDIVVITTDQRIVGVNWKGLVAVVIASDSDDENINEIIREEMANGHKPIRLNPLTPRPDGLGYQDFFWREAEVRLATEEEKAAGE